MIKTLDLEQRIFDYFNSLMAGDQTNFGFSSNPNLCYVAERGTDTPRPNEETLLYYRVDSVTPFGNANMVDDVIIDRTTKIERVEVWRRVHVIVNILSKGKGKAKDALSYLVAVNQTTRGEYASYGVTGTYPSVTGTIEFPVYYIDPNFRDLTELENRSWSERVEADFHFNYKDVIAFEEQNLIVAPSSVYLTKTKVDFNTELK
jgi:hypothetical protein